tara:strand:- start:1418 stop:1987 length:570 start_codon:yes stop_codon:yes gene_type:complete
MTKGLQYGVFGLIAVGLGWFVFNDNGKQIQNISDVESAISSKRPEPSSAPEFSPGEPQSKLSNKVIPITSIPELLSLNVGDIFSLKGISDKGFNEIEISIAEYDVQDNYTQMQGTTTDNGIAIITVGIQTVNVFIKEVSGLYEFSGKGFDGVIPKIEKIVWGDDIYIDPQPSNLREVQELAPMGIQVEQ